MRLDQFISSIATVIQDVEIILNSVMHTRNNIGNSSSLLLPPLSIVVVEKVQDSCLDASLNVNNAQGVILDSITLAETGTTDLVNMDLIQHVIAEALGFQSLRLNQIGILEQALIFRKDVIWNAACNSGKSVVSFGFAIMASLHMLDFGEKTKILRFVPIASLINGLYKDCKDCGLIRVCTPGHGANVYLTLEEALSNDNYNLILLHVSRFASLCGHGKQGKINGMSKAGKHSYGLHLGQNIFSNDGERLIFIYDEAHTMMTLPFDDIYATLELINIFCKKSQKIVCSATLLTGQCANDNESTVLTTSALTNHFHLRSNPSELYVRIESSRRNGIHRISVNLSTIFSSIALSQPHTIMTNYHLPLLELTFRKEL